ncbi:hypothetical protein ARMGADRAFT_1034143 [Armillaria gallica]|uniref:Uncharacterized protein n=1 Tax=Armillaria gallica TaxID=47427 RepID=A0A2H3CYT9_ARMGA|nr:hypothetical protein ARMGADRAFT_1034143 [Armillaria gallica]
MSALHALLHSTLNKAPAIWDTDLCDVLSNPTIMSQVEEADVFLKGHWKAWMFGPDEVARILKNSTFTSEDLKYLKEKTPPPEPSSSIQKNSQPIMKKRKTHNHSPLTQSVKMLSTKPRLKPKLSSARVKNEPFLPEKEGSVASGKAPACSRACKGGKIPIVKVPTLCHKKGVTPPPAVISEDTHTDSWGCSPTLITTELMLDRIFTDLPLLSVLHLLHKDATGCTMCAGHWVLCQHKEPLSSFIEMHDCNFLAADCQICHLLNVLHEAYQLCTAALCNLLQAFSQVEGAHDMDVFKKFARECSTGCHLLIDMGLIRDEDGVLQCITAPQLRHYYPCPLTVHSEMTPEPQLPMFSVLQPDIRPVGGMESDEHSDGDHQDKVTVEKDLERDQLLPSSPIHPDLKAGPSIMNYGSSVWPDMVGSAHTLDIPRDSLGEREWNHPPSQSYQFYPGLEARHLFGPY